MNQSSNIIIILLILVVLIAFVMISLIRRAKNDPASLVNPIRDYVVGADDDLYDFVERYVDTRDKVSRTARPKLPDAAEQKELISAMEEKSKKAQEKMANENLEDLELW